MVNKSGIIDPIEWKINIFSKITVLPKWDFRDDFSIIKSFRKNNHRYNNSKIFTFRWHPGSKWSLNPWNLCFFRVLPNQDTSPIYSRNSPWELSKSDVGMNHGGWWGIIRRIPPTKKNTLLGHVGTMFFLVKHLVFFGGGLSNAWGRHNFTHLEHIVWWTKGSASYSNLHWQICRISMKCWSLNRHNTWSIFILPIFGEKTLPGWSCLQLHLHLRHLGSYSTQPWSR